MTKNKQSAFTIVELLIVIVIIGILAALIINNFSNAQKQARNSQTIDGVTKFYRALVAYGTENGAYPSETSSSCLGEITDYPDGCYDGSPRASFNEALRPYLGSTLPNANANNECLTMYGGCRRGAAYRYVSSLTVDGTSHPWTITYLLRNTDTCKGPNVAGGTWSASSRTPNASGYIEQSGSTRLCRLLLPDPKTL